MPRPYSTDLRERVLTAYEAGEGSQARVAERYRIGERTLSGWLKAAREEGRRAPKPRGACGPAPLGGEGAVLAALVTEQHDATLAEYDKGDHLPPNDAGYKAMAESVDLGLLGVSR